MKNYFFIHKLMKKNFCSLTEKKKNINLNKQFEKIVNKQSNNSNIIEAQLGLERMKLMNKISKIGFILVIPPALYYFFIRLNYLPFSRKSTNSLNIAINSINISTLLFVFLF